MIFKQRDIEKRAHHKKKKKKKVYGSYLLYIALLAYYGVCKILGA